jgi:UDPglucose 6-dehydrogenase
MIAVLGLGFVGLTTALGFAEKGMKVRGFDVDQSRMDSLERGIVPFFEPGVNDALTRHGGRNFEVAKSIEAAISSAEVVFVCVGTPQNEDGSADLKYIRSAISSVIEHRNGDYKVVVIKSTVPPRTVKDFVAEYIREQGLVIGRDIGLASNPEFLREGKSWEDFLYPDRVVVGVEDERSKEVLKSIYEPFHSLVYFVNYTTAEFIKYLSNTLLSSLISFSNDMSMIANALGDVVVADAFKILHKDRRWFGNPANMSSYVYPGCGFGGYCLPKDTSALYKQALRHGYESKHLQNVLEINEAVVDFHVRRVVAAAKPGDKIGILGLSFKAGSDDVRDSPANKIIRGLIKMGHTSIIGYDPMANQTFKEMYGEHVSLQYAKSLDEIVKMADILVLATAWDEFKQNQALIKSKPFFDLRYTITGSLS